MSNIREYVPPIYNDVEEMDTLINSQDKMIDLADDFLNTIYNSQYISIAPEIAVKEYEKIFGILPSSSDSLEFRRARLINRLSMTPPFSLPDLRKKLDDLIGINKYDCYVDYENYTLYVESSAENQAWVNEIYITINKIKPVNIVFINKPLIVYNNNVSEDIEAFINIYNYRLGTTWILGRKAFRSTESGGLIKMSNISSIKNKFLNDIAVFSASDINNVLINNSKVISEFNVKEAENNIAIIEYSVPASLGLTELNNIKLRDANNNNLTESSVYVPILEDIVIKHNIYVKEGV